MSWYKDGTIDVANGSPVINGTGTNFIENVLSGDAFHGPDDRVYEIAAVVSATQLTLASNYAGATAAGQGYKIQPTPSRIGTLNASVNALITDFAAIRDGIGSGNLPDGTAAAPGLRFGADGDTGLWRAGVNAIAWSTAGVERMRLTNAGLGIGKNPAYPIDVTGITRSDTFRSNSPGTAAAPAVDVGGAGNGLYIESGIRLSFATGGARRARLEPTFFIAGDDNVQDLGLIGTRWKNVFATNGTIQTSDEREKTWRGPPTAAELVAAKRIAAELGFFQWNSSIAAEGASNARYHFGLKAQAVWAIMADEGLIDPIAEGVDPDSAYAFLCWDRWEEERDEADNVTREAGDRFGIRTDQLTLFLIAAQEARLAALEAAAS